MLNAPALALTDDAPITLDSLAARWLRDHDIASPAGEGEMVSAEFRADGFYEVWNVVPRERDKRTTLNVLACALRKLPSTYAVVHEATRLVVTLRFNAYATARRVGTSNEPALQAGAAWLADVYPTFATQLEPRVELSRDGFAVVLKLVRGTPGAVPVTGLGNVLDAAGWRHRAVVAAWPVDPFRVDRGLCSGTLGRFHVRTGRPVAVGIPVGTADVVAGAHVDAAVGTVVYAGTREVLDDKRAPKGYGLWGTGERVLIGAVLRAEASLEIIAPDGSTTTVPTERHYRSGITLAAPAALGWLTERGFADVAEQLYAALDHRERLRLSTPQSGAECQWCGCGQRLRHHRMVDHGYCYPQAPGWRGGALGQREGSCVGVGHLPYEKSCDLLQELLPGLVAAEERTRIALESLQRDIADRKAMCVPEAWVRPGADPGDVTVPYGHELWMAAGKLLVATASLQWARARGNLQWCSYRIRRWTLRPTYEDHAAKG